MTADIRHETEFLESPAQYLKGVGPRLAAMLAERGIETVLDVLLQLPVEYRTFGSAQPMRTVEPEQTAAILVRPVEPPRRLRRIWRAYVQDDTDTAEIFWFNKPYGIEKLFAPDAELLLWGKAGLGRDTRLRFTHPRLWLAKGERPDVEVIHRAHPKLRFLARAAQSAIEKIPPQFDPLPAAVRDGLPSWHEALRQAHAPRLDEVDPLTRTTQGQRRILLDQLVAAMSALLSERRRQRALPGRAIRVDDKAVAAARNALGFDLTSDQNKAIADVLGEMQGGGRMNRILQGDVGSGKTAVAIVAAAAACGDAQVAVLAPTEILARQHYESFGRVLGAGSLGGGVGVELLVSGLNDSERGGALQRLATGQSRVAIGTHALLGESVRFRDLGLLVIDEQHRFGVRQRAELRLRYPEANLLMLTATPIPRTMMMSWYGDLDASTIRSMPPGRKPIQTQWVRSEGKREVYETIRAAMDRGEKIYFIYPAVEEGTLEIGDVTSAHKRLSDHFGEGRVVLAHGKLDERQKTRAMQAFRDGTSPILVATTVVEVGIDVREATVIVVADADRYGLSQLHQLRGRVGRSDRPSYCYLLSDTPDESPAAERLRALCETTDGFVIAEKDLELRGAGELLGEQQAGKGMLDALAWKAGKALLNQAHGIASQIVDEPDVFADEAERQRFNWWLGRFGFQEKAFEGG